MVTVEITDIHAPGAAPHSDPQQHAHANGDPHLPANTGVHADADEHRPLTPSPCVHSVSMPLMLKG